MKEPEKLIETNLREGVTNWDAETFKVDVEAGKPVQARMVDVHCPYCLVGTAKILVIGPDVIGPGDAQTADVKPKQCDQCLRWFRIGYRAQFVGIQMEG